MELYFAYGSNLWLTQMQRRCPSARVEGTGTLRDYRLWFPLRSPRWDGGVASVLPDEGSRVEGVLYRISLEDLHALDVFEGVPDNMYQRLELPVIAANETRKAWTYMGRIEERAPFPASRKYIDTILRGAREHGLGEDWIRFLQDFAVTE